MALPVSYSVDGIRVLDVMAECLKGFSVSKSECYWVRFIGYFLFVLITAF